MTKKVHLLGVSPCYIETAKKTAIDLFMDKANRIETVFARKDDFALLEWVKEQFLVSNKGINVERSTKITHINNATIFYDSKIKFIINYIRENLGKKNILLFANGDPNFFGIGGSILNELKANEKRFVEIYPSFSFMQMGFSKLKIPMTDSYIMSLHGRDLRNLYDALYSRKNSIGIYTDGVNTPGVIYKELEEKGFIDEFNFYVLTDLCSKNEKIYKNFSEDVFESLSDKKNIVIMEKKEPADVKKSAGTHPRGRFKTELQNQNQNQNHGSDRSRHQVQNQVLGIEDEKYFHMAGEPTKKEIRAISISLMNLKKDSVIIDAGCGSGSISIEAAAISDLGMVYSMDKSEAKIENLRKNIKKFQRPNIVPILGEMPEIFKMFKNVKEKENFVKSSENAGEGENGINKSDSISPLLPDVIFIGGGGKNLENILADSFHILKNDGIIVINSILLSSFNNIMSFINKFNLSNKNKMKYDVITVNIARLKEIKSDSYFHPLNQIYITKIVKYINLNQRSGVSFKYDTKLINGESMNKPAMED